MPVPRSAPRHGRRYLRSNPARLAFHLVRTDCQTLAGGRSLVAREAACPGDQTNWPLVGVGRHRLSSTGFVLTRPRLSSLRGHLLRPPGHRQVAPREATAMDGPAQSFVAPHQPQKYRKDDPAALRDAATRPSSTQQRQPAIRFSTGFPIAAAGALAAPRRRRTAWQTPVTLIWSTCPSARQKCLQKRIARTDRVGPPRTSRGSCGDRLFAPGSPLQPRCRPIREPPSRSNASAY